MPTPEHARIPALQPHHPSPTPGVLDQQRVDVLLRKRVVARRLAHIDAQGMWRGFVEERRIEQAVVENHIRLPKQALAPDGEKPWVARARADERDSTARQA